MLHPVFMQNSSSSITLPITLNSSLQLTCVAVHEVCGDDLLLAAVLLLLVPGDLHHLLLLLHLVETGEPGLTLCLGAQGGDGLRGLHEVTMHTHR